MLEDVLYQVYVRRTQVQYRLVVLAPCPLIKQVLAMVGLAVENLVQRLPRYADILRLGLVQEPVPELGNLIETVILIASGDKHVGVDHIEHRLKCPNQRLDHPWFYAQDQCSFRRRQGAVIKGTARESHQAPEAVPAGGVEVTATLGSLLLCVLLP